MALCIGIKQGVTVQATGLPSNPGYVSISGIKANYYYVDKDAINNSTFGTLSASSSGQETNKLEIVINGEDRAEFSTSGGTYVFDGDILNFVVNSYLSAYPSATVLNIYYYFDGYGNYENTAQTFLTTVHLGEEEPSQDPEPAVEEAAVETVGPFTVTFLDCNGETVSVQSVAYQGDAVAPTGYGTYEGYTNVSANMDLRPTSCSASNLSGYTVPNTADKH